MALAQVKMCHTLFFGAYLVSSLGRGTRSRQDLESILDENRFAAILDSVQTFLVQIDECLPIRRYEHRA